MQRRANCFPGKYISKPGTKTADRVCTVCAAGKFTNASNLDECWKWTVCRGLGETLAKGTILSDRVCRVAKKESQYTEDELDSGRRNTPSLLAMAIIFYLFD